MNALIVRITALLQGEPLRFIVYGAAIVVWLVVAVANQLGIVHFGPAISLPDALIDASAASAFLIVLTERIRKLVTPVANPSLPEGTIVTVVTPADEPNRLQVVT
jgi:hypothetical protein